MILHLFPSRRVPPPQDIPPVGHPVARQLVIPVVCGCGHSAAVPRPSAVLWLQRVHPALLRHAWYVQMLFSDMPGMFRCCSQTCLVRSDVVLRHAWYVQMLFSDMPGMFACCSQTCLVRADVVPRHAWYVQMLFSDMPGTFRCCSQTCLVRSDVVLRHAWYIQMLFSDMPGTF